MIQPKELRQGNIIGWRTGFGELITGPVHEVHADKVAIGAETIIDSNSSGQGFMKVEGIEPIALTPELLKRIGFGKEDRDKLGTCWVISIMHSARRVLGICNMTSRTLVSFVAEPGNIVMLRPIYHIHELQNLYFDLTGEELKLKAL